MPVSAPNIFFGYIQTQLKKYLQKRNPDSAEGTTTCLPFVFLMVWNSYKYGISVKYYLIKFMSGKSDIFAGEYTPGLLFPQQQLH